MIELLILYSLKDRERTLYALRSDIMEKFGCFTRPSVGTIHPAMKRLQECNAVTVRKDFSQGGKKSTFYSLAMHWQKKFRDLFFSPLSDNPTNFYTELQTRIAVMSLLDEDLKETFIDDALLKLESFLLDLKNTAEDEYIKFDDIQFALLKKNIADVESYKQFMESLREK